MLTIHKFNVGVQDEFTLSLPENAQILTVDVQREDVCFWVLLDPNLEIEKIERKFVCFGTGHRIPFRLAELQKVGTVLLHSEALVFHYFEVLR